jgi:hypothetical protein
LSYACGLKIKYSVANGEVLRMKGGLNLELIYYNSPKTTAEFTKKKYYCFGKVAIPLKKKYDLTVLL